MAREPGFVFEYLKQVETLAHDVLSDRRDIIELNKKRDKTREAARALKKVENKDEPTWLCCGNLFINFNQQQANYILEKDQKSYDEQINKLHSGLKNKVNKLYEAEDKPELKGYDLMPISKEEKQSLFELVGKN